MLKCVRVAVQTKGPFTHATTSAQRTYGCSRFRTPLEGYQVRDERARGGATLFEYLIAAVEHVVREMTAVSLPEIAVMQLQRHGNQHHQTAALVRRPEQCLCRRVSREGCRHPLMQGRIDLFLLLNV